MSFSRAIDGARTRGLDLGKVARYQLRHYRICWCLLSDTSSIISDRRAPVNNFFHFLLFFSVEEKSAFFLLFHA